MPGSILGTSVRRVEDRDLIIGASTYVGNLALPGLLHLAFVRSPLAHGRITGIDPAAAAAAPGVVAVYTAADLGLAPHHGLFVVNPELPRPPLATDRVRFVGEAVAVVVGETKAAAVDAVELVEVEYEDLPAVVDPEAALEPDAPPQFDGRGPTPRSSYGRGWSTSGWRCCRWRATRSPSSPAATRAATTI